MTTPGIPQNDGAYLAKLLAARNALSSEYQLVCTSRALDGGIMPRLLPAGKTMSTNQYRKELREEMDALDKKIQELDPTAEIYVQMG